MRIRRPLRIATMLCFALAANSASFTLQADDGESQQDLDAWFEEDAAPPVPQADENELIFLTDGFEGKILHSLNRLFITAQSLEQGWVRLEQCYRGLDAVPEAEVVYRYNEMRGLRIASRHNIARAVAQGQSVQLSDVGQDARLCVQAEARILRAQGDGSFVLRNGPFHRRFLDGYFPLHVTLVVHYPAELLKFTGSTPSPQAGFTVESRKGRVTVDSRFAGKLNTEIRFSAADAPP